MPKFPLGFGMMRLYTEADDPRKKVVIMEPVKGGLLARLPKEIHDELNLINPGASDASYLIEHTFL